MRRLRVYAFDPNASLDLGSARYSHATISLPWADPTEEGVSPGPVNEYLEVIDVDPCSDEFYEPIDLNDAAVLAQDGLPPSEGDPRFHQQMAFAVVMKTIKLFERALGRKMIWRPKWDPESRAYVPTPKLRVYPHAMREANAYYSPGKRALLFGYFTSTQASAGASWIFTVLSHDIIVHETTHAILDGLHRRYSEPTSIDSLAFHEAFADIAALFSHFQLYEAVYDFIDSRGGRLDEAGLLSGLASQFAKGTTGRASLRDYLDRTPDPDLLARVREPHERGAILVAAVFDAFLSIYSARTADLLRLSGVRLGASQILHPDLVARLAHEAAKSADHVLRMCIRALDYLPPVDVRFGEFLRAIITADMDLIPDDRLNYRLAFVEAFRRRGIFPDHCLSLSPDNLKWEPPQPQVTTEDIVNEDLELLPIFNRAKMQAAAERNRRKLWYWLTNPSYGVLGQPHKTGLFEAILAEARRTFAFDVAGPATTKGKAAAPAAKLIETILPHLVELGVPDDAIRQMRDPSLAARDHFTQWDHFVRLLRDNTPKLAPNKEIDLAWEEELGIFFTRRAGNLLHSIVDSREASTSGDATLPVEVHSVRTTRRSGPDGQDIRQLVIEVTQKRRGFLDPQDQLACDAGAPLGANAEEFTFRGGATMIIDLREYKLRYVIRKSIDDPRRLAEQRDLLSTPNSYGFTYGQGASDEPFALLHRH